LESLNNERVSLDNKITILGFLARGYKTQGNLLILTKNLSTLPWFEDLQFVMLPLGTEDDIRVLWMMPDLLMCRNGILFYHSEQINEYYGQLKLVGKLDKNSGTSDVYIVDKKRNLRVEKKGYKEGYDTFHPAELSNEMLDDFKIIL
jgi:hypothetical protein